MWSVIMATVFRGHRGTYSLLAQPQRQVACHWGCARRLWNSQALNMHACRMGPACVGLAVLGNMALLVILWRTPKHWCHWSQMDNIYKLLVLSLQFYKLLFHCHNKSVILLEIIIIEAWIPAHICICRYCYDKFQQKYYKQLLTSYEVFVVMEMFGSHLC